MTRLLPFFLMLAALAAPGAAGAVPVTVSGYAAAEVRFFPGDPADSAQKSGRLSPSLALQPEFRAEWNGGRDRALIRPFLRLDGDDAERTHADLREAYWLRDQGSWEVLTGLGRVFWGVTESRHLVDIVNQTDLVEHLDEEDKLGQPMVNLTLFQSFGAVSLFVLPGFRERTFPGRRARFRGALPIASDEPVFESPARRRRIDFAARWSNAFGAWDVGATLFHGTGREPRLVPSLDGGGAPVLVPHYDIISQAGLDIQYTRENWLWKLEALGRRGNGKRFAAMVAGFEYTLFGLFGPVDLSILAEYLRDGRGAAAPATSADDDLFGALRLTFNNASSTTALIGATVDRSSGGAVLRFEAQHRLSDTWSLGVEAWGFTGIPASDTALAGIRRDDFVQVRLQRSF
ncbi:MAG: hypothetical protein IID55_09520 [Proteobacteria bacterium]|nr:hypothetical protein [Pseudomonadota bacterium]